jgi:hypothetical protein
MKFGLFIDPIADIAVLGAPDYEVFAGSGRRL